MGPRRTENWSRQLLPPGDVSRRRREYASLRDKHNDDPRVSAASGSLESNNPLMASKGSSWDVYFRTREVRATIALDLERLHPGDDFYSSGDVQRALLDLLTVWALENPSVGYKQGMHELASLVFSQRASDVAGADSAHAWGALASPPTSPVVEGAPDLSAAYVEHDAYAMFAALMGPTRASNPDAPHEATPLRVVSYFEDPPKRGAASEVQAACDRVFRALGAVDAPLRAHLAKLDVEPQLFLLRWLRVLFSREFHLEDAMRCWDAIFSANAADAADAAYAFDSAASTRGGVRDFVEAFAVAMLLFVRADVMAQDDFGGCLRRLQKFPPVEDMDALLERARAIQPVVSAGGTYASDQTSEPNSNGRVASADSGPPGGAHSFMGFGAVSNGGGAREGSRREESRHRRVLMNGGGGAREFLTRAKDASAAGRDRAGEFFAKAAGAASHFVGTLMESNLNGPGAGGLGVGSGSGARDGGHPGLGGQGAGGAGASSAAAALAATGAFLPAAQEGYASAGGRGGEGARKGRGELVGTGVESGIPLADAGVKPKPEAVFVWPIPEPVSEPVSEPISEPEPLSGGEVEAPESAPGASYEDVSLDDAAVKPGAGPEEGSPREAEEDSPPGPEATEAPPLPASPKPAAARRRPKSSLFDEDDGLGLGLGLGLGAPTAGAATPTARGAERAASLFADDGEEDPLFARGVGNGAAARSAAFSSITDAHAPPANANTRSSSAALAGAASAIEGVLAAGHARVDDDAEVEAELRETLEKLRGVMAKLDAAAASERRSRSGDEL